ncbi:acyl CoA binding protein-domain-containing protein [Gilbertella persicaria]|uniref:acyl CoA binding protein-domain-containing protein n=1 Tax=Gilbertella persicaria TaxID=101096 RepID=UPI00221F1B76|nr:acyl CoA binding protein-domain-containing protein [Gilbertella persicaria]KAI8048948.1 acyl CoA binding protein-domain-containing protein [Gilbertella persicaria]
MTSIPPHYTDRFIVSRYNKALHFVQNLPASSSFQPTKNQKLELYALYKQVSVGDINTQRPGLFDVVGRAKWDAWKKLEGMSVLEARHIYVEALLRIAAEAYKKNLGREEAQQIMHAFAIMRPSGDDDDSEDDDNTSHSEEEEEQAYLNQIQSSITRRPGSVASIQTTVTAPTTPRQMPINGMRPRSRLNVQMMTRDDLPQPEAFVDPNVNPWQHIPPLSTRNHHDTSSEDESTSNRKRLLVRKSSLRLPSPISKYPNMTRFQSPASTTTTSSSVTTTPHNMYEANRLYTENTTRKAIEALQTQVVALNDRIDDLRRELVERDRQRYIHRQDKEDKDKEEEEEEEEQNDWTWVIKAAIKHAGVNLMTVFILLIILYKSGSPVAYAIMKQASKMWQSFKLRVLISRVI